MQVRRKPGREHVFVAESTVEGAAAEAIVEAAYDVRSPIVTASKPLRGCPLACRCRWRRLGACKAWMVHGVMRVLNPKGRGLAGGSAVECAQLSKRAQWDSTFAGGRVLAEFDPHTRTVSTEHHFAGSSYLAAPRSLQQADSPLLSLWRLPPQIHQRHEYPPNAQESTILQSAQASVDA